MTTKKIWKIDIEPKWEILCDLAVQGSLPAEELRPACKMMDILRQAQKAGKKGFVITFPGVDGPMEIDEVK